MHLQGSCQGMHRCRQPCTLLPAGAKVLHISGNHLCLVQKTAAVAGMWPSGSDTLRLYLGT